jgi:hypothetical protein
MAAFTLDSTMTHATPAGRSAATTTASERPRARTARTAAKAVPANSSSLFSDQRARIRGSSSAPATAPTPTAASRTP